MVVSVGRCCFILFVAVVYAAGLVRPVTASQTEPRVADGKPSIDYALLNQPGPRWLPGVDLSDQDLYGVNLANANLREAKLERTSLTRADLSGALLVLATLQHADLTHANLQNATLSLADLRFANLPGANLADAQMAGAILAGAVLDKAQLVGGDLRQSDLKHASLRAADLSHALLAGANLLAADLTDANLSHADLSSVNLAQARLDGAMLEDVIYDHVTVWPANFDLDAVALNGELPVGMSNGRAGDGQPRQHTEQGLSVTLTLMPQLLHWYNRTARPQDGSLIDDARQMDLLGGMTIGSKMVIFKSVDVAEVIVPHTADKFDTIGYNLEHGPHSPQHEQADPVGSVKRMRALADAYGLKLAVGPDHSFAVSHGTAMAPYADSFTMQVQRVQSQPETVRDFVVPMAAAVRAANPSIRTTLQVRTEGTADDIAALIDSVGASIDGVDILSSHETAEIAMTLIEMLHAKPGPSRAASVAGPETRRDGTPPDQPLTGMAVWRIVLQLLVLALTPVFVLTLWWSRSS